MDEFSVRVGSLISGMILRFDGPDVRVDLGRTEGVMPAGERVPNERLNPNQRLTFLLKEIIETLKGKQIILSRAAPLFVQKLFEREVPEMASGSVEARAIAREAGVRTKMAVFSNQSGVDPVGSCVGQKGVRVQAVTNELGGERVDIIPWNEKLAELIEASLSPAEGLSVTLNEKEKVAVVKAPEDQLSLAIGKEGQNVRLVAKLTGWKIEVKGIPSEKKEIKMELDLSPGKAGKAEKKEEVMKDKASGQKAQDQTPIAEVPEKQVRTGKKEKKGKSKPVKKQEPKQE
jgi:N utilization substance protein A